MTRATGEFLERLSAVEHEPLLAGLTTSVTLEVIDGERIKRWSIHIEDGRVTTSARAARDSTCLVRAERAVLDALARGEVNATAALLRGTIEAEGDPEVLLRLQRVFPGPPGARGPVLAAARETRA